VKEVIKILEIERDICNTQISRLQRLKNTSANEYSLLFEGVLGLIEKEKQISAAIDSLKKK